MTCIIGLLENGTVYLAGDSCVSNGWYEKNTLADRKIFELPPFLIGISGDLRLADIVRWQFSPRDRSQGETDERYMVCGFADQLRLRLKELGYSKIESNYEETHNGEMLVAYRQKLYSVGPNFDVLALASGLMAIGSGREYALGAMNALKDMEPEARLLKSLEIAALYTKGVGAPFYVMKG